MSNTPSAPESLIINGTNRANSQTERVSLTVAAIMDELGISYSYYSLEQLDPALLTPDMYDAEQRTGYLDNLQSAVFIPAIKWIFVAPEYNGSFPGMLKVLLDLLSVKWQAETFYLKKALLIGVASGRAGNLRGLDHLTGVLNYLKMVVYPVKQPISRINTLLEAGEKAQMDPETRHLLRQLLQQFQAF
jgi:chromate reductase, NAD(P)H dehydrogenase (quinone)